LEEIEDLVEVEEMEQSGRALICKRKEVMVVLVVHLEEDLQRHQEEIPERQDL
jgi:hypothetical protein